MAYEKSGRVRDALLAEGLNAYSCDLLPSETDTDRHFQGDAFKTIYDNLDDLCFLGAHYPCDYLAVSGMHWTARGLRDPKLTEKAIEDVEALWKVIQTVGAGYIENPISVLSTRSILGKPTQIIQPWMFGEDASKSTCLWIHGLPKLRPTKMVEPRIVNGKKRWGNQTDSGQNRLGPSKTRKSDRSRTYLGIAAAMAAQWGPILKDRTNADGED